VAPGRRARRSYAQNWLSPATVVQWARTPLRAFAEVLQREGCSDILIQDYEHPRFDALVLLGRQLGLGVYATFQGGDVCMSPLERKVRPRTRGACDRLIVPSARERQRLRDDYGVRPGAMADVPNPIDTDQWQPMPKADARRRLGLSDPETVFVTHGRIDLRRKGLDVLLEAWRRFSRRMPGARLIVVGSGQDDDAFGQALTGAIGVGWLRSYVTSPEAIRCLLSAADAYVTLSRTEGMPVAPLEAMACGLPLIASDAHGLADILANAPVPCGVMAPRKDVRTAAAALEALASSPEARRRLGEAARRYVTQTYSIDAVGQGLRAAMLPG